jgi:hypothetical protein
MEHPQIKYLDLSRNRFTRSIISALTAGLEVNKTLTHLRLDSNNIDAVPAAALADAAHMHPTLTHLSLRYNSVRSGGTEAIARIFVSKPGHSLRYVDLRDNYVGPVGTRAMLTALNVNVPPEASLLPEPSYEEVAAAKVRKTNKKHLQSPAQHIQQKYDRSYNPHLSYCYCVQEEHGAETVREETDTPLASGPILVGSGAKAILVLRRHQSTPSKSDSVASEDNSETATSVTADGSVVQTIVAPKVRNSGEREHKAGDVDVLGTRVIRLDPAVIFAVLNRTA